MRGGHSRAENRSSDSTMGVSQEGNGKQSERTEEGALFLRCPEKKKLEKVKEVIKSNGN